jgi:hypothetical protein
VFTKERRTFSVKILLDGKLTLGHNWKVNLWNQTDYTVLNGKKLLIKNNITSSKTSFAFHDLLGKGVGREKNPKWSLGLFATAWLEVHDRKVVKNETQAPP